MKMNNLYTMDLSLSNASSVDQYALNVNTHDNIHNGFTRQMKLERKLKIQLHLVSRHHR